MMVVDEELNVSLRRGFADLQLGCHGDAACNHKRTHHPSHLAPYSGYRIRGAIRNLVAMSEALMVNATPAPFSAPYAEDDGHLAELLLAGAQLAPERERRIDAEARDLIGAIRAHRGGFGGAEEMLREYALSTREGLALMVLAEALLRPP
jgi:hypothetical protein